LPSGLFLESPKNFFLRCWLGHPMICVEGYLPDNLVSGYPMRPLWSPFKSGATQRPLGDRPMTFFGGHCTSSEVQRCRRKHTMAVQPGSCSLAAAKAERQSLNDRMSAVRSMLCTKQTYQCCPSTVLTCTPSQESMNESAIETMACETQCLARRFRRKVRK
jgi:hypothetical protein